MKEQLKAYFNKNIEENYFDLSKFYEYNLFEFCELTSLKYEILNCILLGLSQAVMFSTNHLLERLLKLSLIKKYTLGCNYSNPILYNQKIQEAIVKYDRKNLCESIRLTYEENIISEQQKDRLNELRKTFRNPFSHAEVSKINDNAPKFITGRMFSFEEVKQNLINKEPIKIPEPIKISTSSPAIAQLYQEEVSKQSAYNYFKEIYSLLLEIENNFKQNETERK